MRKSLEQDQWARIREYCRIRTLTQLQSDTYLGYRLSRVADGKPDAISGGQALAPALVAEAMKFAIAG